MKSQRHVEFVIYGLHPALFCSEVDSYFICPICYFVASDPLTCSSCEQIYCKGCVSRYVSIKENKCILCKLSLNLAVLRKFPKKIYESFFLYCPNYNYGCRYEGGIQEIHNHILGCQFKKLSCLSPLCAHNFLLKDQPIPDAEVCSVQCLENYTFYEMIGKADKNQISRFY